MMRANSAAFSILTTPAMPDRFTLVFCSTAIFTGSVSPRLRSRSSSARSRSAALRECSAMCLRFSRIHSRSTPMRSTDSSRRNAIRARTVASRISRAADAPAASRSAAPNALQYASVLLPQHSPATSWQKVSRLRERRACAAGAKFLSRSKRSGTGVFMAQVYQTDAAPCKANRKTT